uniref:Uncharacterized protein n=1 Tax=Arundo donax TaxID=35708 RepID=A0A0A8YF14_ARUDO
MLSFALENSKPGRQEQLVSPLTLTLQKLFGPQTPFTRQRSLLGHSHLTSVMGSLPCLRNT